MTTRPDAPRSRRERPAKPALTRAGIIATAVELVRAEGLDRVTMRRLAQELDTGPASLYVYVRNTAELHAAVLDDLMGAVDLSPVSAGGDWRDRLVQVLVSYTTVLFEYPGLAQSALVARPSGKRYLDLAEALLSLLAQGGVPAGQAAWGLDHLMLIATASAAEHGTQQRAVHTQDDWDALTVALRSASADTHPHIAALGADLLSGSGQGRLIWGFRMMIDGMLHTPRPDSAPAADTPAE
jgi:AcrR family transcriptional regulator